MTVAVGSPAPDFTLPTDQGELSLAALKGRPLVVYFYPKDDTSGCTREAIGFSSLAEEFAKAGATVIGISPDTVDKHGKFRVKHKLTVALGSDPDHRVAESYGAWGEKSLYGKKYLGIIRSTFLIGPDGIVARVWPKVKVEGHAEDVLAAVNAL
ncbi:peroxiredoxin [Pleomorphomonas sp. JP5]|uniref:peroxiredoxin n=1 Tax=Pleomorphomonas sp. JP5 TaxID=2942998 RepID=UPI0020449590|nr:peroxiredoxin [Pleomorphomonas sp. JP5]MCM5556102.1 peroxiredoxin [Pleomorphomonas sp. JP5]